MMQFNAQGAEIVAALKGVRGSVELYVRWGVDKPKYHTTLPDSAVCIIGSVPIACGIDEMGELRVTLSAIQRQGLRDFAHTNAHHRLEVRIWPNGHLTVSTTVTFPPKE